MVRHRAHSSASTSSSNNGSWGQQELASMYDYLAKIILLGPSGSGKSCLLHRFVKDEWRVLSSQTIGVEFASKIVKVGSGTRRKRIKLQLWDTAGTERFRSVSRSYYRGAAGAILIYDISSRASFTALPTFLADAKALASPDLIALLAGNKSDLAEPSHTHKQSVPLVENTGEVSGERTDFITGETPTYTANYSSNTFNYSSANTPKPPRLGSQNTATTAPDGRQVSSQEASQWASTTGNIHLAVEVSAFTGDGVDELFTGMAEMILTKIELGEIDPDDPRSGIQYGDSGGWGMGMGGSDGGSVKSGLTVEDGMRRRRRGPMTMRGLIGDVGEWEQVFGLGGRGGGGRRGRERRAGGGGGKCCF